MKTFISLLIASALVASCSPVNETATVQDLNRQFIDAWNAKNPDKVISFLADDVQFIQGSTHFRGKSEVAKRWVQETLPTLNDLKTNVVSSTVDSRTAYEAGTFSVDVLPSAADQPHGYGEGNFVLLWKKSDDGTWKLNYAQLEDLPVVAKNP